MAKALKKTQPMSSIDRFFENASLEGALARPEEKEEPAVAEVVEALKLPPEPKSEPVAAAMVKPQAAPPKETKAPKSEPALRIAPTPSAVEMPAPRRNELLRMAPRTGEPVDRQREFQLTRSTDAVLEDLVILYKRATGAELTRSHVLRAILKALGEKMPDLKTAAADIGPLRRPSNAKGFEDAREEFEDQITQSFLKGLVG